MTRSLAGAHHDAGLAGAASAVHRAGLAHGNGRSYGDAALNPGGIVWHARGLDRFIAFDEETGMLQCEAGVLLAEIQSIVQPRGWTLPVTPGTQLITLGGAIANDVHGKNHHLRGNFGDHVRELALWRSDGRLIRCGPGAADADSQGQSMDWFRATVGGIGLTGVIGEARLQLVPCNGPWLEAETIAFSGLEEFFALSSDSESAGAPGWEHTVSWLDCLSGRHPRGLFMRARPATDQTGRLRQRRRLEVPLVPPVSLVNRLTLRPLNTSYFHLHRRRRGVFRTLQEPYLYPLDALGHWNRIYGPKGFYQYQSVVPMAEAREATQAMLDVVARSGQGSFLGVLKTFGDRPSTGLLSFPRHGVTLALDFPNRGASTARLFEQLDAIVTQAGGRLYLAKDARMSREMFEAGYPRAAEFGRWRDPGIASSMSRRLWGY